MAEEFKAAVESCKTYEPATPVTDDEKLKAYGLFKQATVGDVEGSRPGIFSPTARYKWDAWNANKGMSKEEAMTLYVAEIKRQQEEHGSK